MTESSRAHGARRAWWTLFAALVALFVFRLVYLRLYLLIPDEAYYWTWSRKLAFCYYDQPGMVAWMGRLFARLFGETAAGLRTGAWLLAAGASAMLYRMARSLLGDRTWAMAAVLLVNLLPIFAAGALVFIHDTCLIFFWTLAALALVRLAEGAGARTWALVAFAMLCALYSKFSAVLLVPCIVLFLVLSDAHRPWLMRVEPYLAAGVVAILFMPVVAWNVSHQWVAYHAVGKLAFHPGMGMAGRAWSVADYLLGQMLLYSPPVFVLGVVGMGATLLSSRRHQEPVRLLLACLSLPIVVYFLYLSFRTKVQANWPMGGFVAGTLLFVDFIRRRMQGPRAATWRAVWVGTWILAVAMATVIHVHPLKRIVPFLEGRDLTDQIYGWDALAARVEAERVRAGATHTFVMARSYQVASELEFYLPGRPRPYCANFGSRGNQYDVDQDFSRLIGMDAILVDAAPSLSVRFQKHFRAVEALDPFEVVREGRTIATYRLYRLRGFTLDGPFRDYFVDPLGTSVQRMIARRAGG